MSSQDPRPPGPGQADPAHPDLSVTDPKAMRALAHPVRIALLEAIGQSGTQTLTATQASELLGESPANCAFHLRTLAKYGFVEEAGGQGRQRPWRLTFRSLDLTPPWPDLETRQAATTLTSMAIDRWLTRARARVLRTPAYPADWQPAVLASESVTYLTASEAKELGEGIGRLLDQYRERLADPARRPAGGQRYELLAFGYPMTDPPPPAEGEAGEGEAGEGGAAGEGEAGEGEDKGGVN